MILKKKLTGVLTLSKISLYISTQNFSPVKRDRRPHIGAHF